MPLGRVGRHCLPRRAPCEVDDRTCVRVEGSSRRTARRSISWTRTRIAVVACVRAHPPATARRRHIAWHTCRLTAQETVTARRVQAHLLCVTSSPGCTATVTGRRVIGSRGARLSQLQGLGLYLLHSTLVCIQILTQRCVLRLPQIRCTPTV